MTDNEIIKALAQCHKRGKGEIDRIICGKCPYYNTICCETHLFVDAILLIKNRKSRSNQRVCGEVERKRYACDRWQRF